MLKTLYRIGMLLTALALAAAAPVHAEGDADDAAIHGQLRALLRGVEDAVNAHDYDKLPQYFGAKMHVVTIAQEVLTAPDQIKPYFESWFGPGKYLVDLKMSLTADALTELNAARDFGIVFGKGLEKYDLADGRHYDFPTRWTATAGKGDDGRWRILTLHIGTNFYENPLVADLQAAVNRYAMIGGAAGLLAGLALGGLLFRRKKA
jgi:ketosteroid isomerase-like protein